MAQDERRKIDIIDDFPFMLRYSKHSDPSFSKLLATPKRGTASNLLPTPDSAEKYLAG
jgi:hypothetical protein